jgi:hypothetical protein
LHVAVKISKNSGQDLWRCPKSSVKNLKRFNKVSKIFLEKSRDARVNLERTETFIAHCKIHSRAREIVFVAHRSFLQLVVKDVQQKLSRSLALPF